MVITIFCHNKIIVEYVKWKWIAYYFLFFFVSPKNLRINYKKLLGFTYLVREFTYLASILAFGVQLEDLFYCNKYIYIYFGNKLCCFLEIFCLRKFLKFLLQIQVSLLNFGNNCQIIWCHKIRKQKPFIMLLNILRRGVCFFVFFRLLGLGVGCCFKEV